MTSLAVTSCPLSWFSFTQFGRWVTSAHAHWLAWTSTRGNGQEVSGCDVPAPIAHSLLPHFNISIHSNTSFTGNSDIAAVCNEDCNCVTSYDPMCGSNDVLYYSPCHAGCLEMDEVDGEAVGFYLSILSTTSVARGGRRASPPPNAFSEFCRYIWKFVGTCKPTSMSFVPTKYLKYQQNIERYSNFMM